ncbi:MAG TPA: CPBP family intramembrane glutamic endopeptidase [Actinomycetota bacterium]
MSAPGVDAPTTRTTRLDLPVTAMLTVAVGLLLVRAWSPTFGSLGRVTGLTATFVAVLVGSLLVPAARGRPQLHPGLVLCIGAGAVGIALLASGRPVTAPIGAWALPLTVLAAVAEEALFRRTMYASLERRGAFVAIGVTAFVFAAMHVPIYGVAVFPVDLGAGALLSWQRWASGSWAVPAATHAAANVAMTVLR